MNYYNTELEAFKKRRVEEYGNIMIDLETLSTNTNAAIISIAAVEFNKKNGEIGDTFKTYVNADDWCKNGRHVDGETVLWWMEKDKELVGQYGRKEAPTLHEALKRLRKFYEEHSADGENAAVVWGNGSTMDITILQSAYEHFGEKTPWAYWAVNDVRTIVSLNPSIKQGMAFNGSKHDPQDDCLYQIAYLVETLNSLKK